MRALTVLAVVLLSGADAAGDKAVAEELKKLEGTWLTIPLEGPEPAGYKPIRLKIDGDKYREIFEGKITEEGTLRVDPSKSPKAMDMTVAKGAHPGRVAQCIYAVEKDALLLCTDTTSGKKGRPEKFDTADVNSGLTKLVREPAKEK
jgi:uncharacterized protein (TIGR03067 family)